MQAIDVTAAEICASADNHNTVNELIRSFTDIMEKDLKEMKRALGRSALSFFLSKEFGLSVLAVTAAISLQPISGIFTIGGLMKGLMDYQDRRRKILREHPASWLFLASSPKLPLI